MGEIYSEEEFYQDNGWPSESLKYVDYCFYNGHITEYGEDYDQFALVDNALYPYIRLTEKRGRCQSPCGHSPVIATDGSFARKSESERDKDCPKIAWGFAAEYLMNLKYDPKQEDYVEIIPRNTLIKDYYGRYLQLYLDNHSGLKFSKLSLEQKELDFLKEHEGIIKGLWEKSTPLAKYPGLYEFAKGAETDYEKYLQKRMSDLSVKPEEKSSSSKNVSRTINQNGEKSVYVENNSGTIIIGSDTPNNAGGLKVHNEAYFAGIEARIAEALVGACATIDVCVAWFTNEKLRDILLEKQKEGIEVRVIIFKDGINKKKGVDLTGLKHKEYRGERGGVEHDKFCVIDNVHSISGSYNWTLSAEHKNDEDATFHFEDYKLASTFTKRFNEIWRRDGKE